MQKRLKWQEIYWMPYEEVIIFVRRNCEVDLIFRELSLLDVRHQLLTHSKHLVSKSFTFLYWMRFGETFRRFLWKIFKRTTV
jgi:hypothetical protein